MKKYEPETNFQAVGDGSLVYNLRTTGRFREGAEEWENDVSVAITARHLTEDQRADVARTIRDALNAKYLENSYSRIADTDGKHLEICRIQLARTVKQRDELAAMWEREAVETDGQGDEIGAKQIRRSVCGILSENVSDQGSPRRASDPN